MNQNIRKVDAESLDEIAELIEGRQPFILTSAKINPINLDNIPKQTVLQVERKWRKQFGSGRLLEMKFAEFMEKVNSDQYYLSTQYAENSENESESPASDDLVKQVLMPPLNELANELTIKLPFAFNLVLQQMNVWIGSGTNNSSGLHHDFHDNFYFLQKGMKKFRLYSPKNYEAMYLYGDVRKLYDNGVIVYNDDEIREDGAYYRDVAEWKVLKAEELLENAKSEQEVEHAELEMDKALEESLKYLSGTDREFEGGDFGDEDEDELHDEELSEENCDENDDSNLEFDSNINTPAQKKQKLQDDEEPKFPPSFSRIPASDLQNQKLIMDKFPKFSMAKPFEVTVNPGQVLFIPAGWFHEVRSSATDDDYHLAVNYWYAPLVSGRSVQSPYNDDYWDEVHRKPFEALLKA